MRYAIGCATALSLPITLSPLDDPFHNSKNLDVGYTSLGNGAVYAGFKSGNRLTGGAAVASDASISLSPALSLAPYQGQRHTGAYLLPVTIQCNRLQSVHESSRGISQLVELVKFLEGAQSVSIAYDDSNIDMAEQLASMLQDRGVANCDLCEDSILSAKIVAKPRKLRTLIGFNESGKRLTEIAHSALDTNTQRPVARLDSTGWTFGASLCPLAKEEMTSSEIADAISQDSYAMTVALTMLLHSRNLDGYAKSILNAFLVALEDGLHTNCNAHLSLNARRVKHKDLPHLIKQRIGKTPHELPAFNMATSKPIASPPSLKIC